MGISPATFYRWINDHCEICEALKKGKAPVDIEVENALLKRVLGYDYEEVTTEESEYPTGKFDEDGQPIVRVMTRTKRVTKMVLPDVTAQIYWLNNRRPDRWRNKISDQGNAGTLNKLDELLEEAKRAAYAETGGISH